MKAYIIKVGYYKFATFNKELAVEALEGLVPVDVEYIKDDGVYIYIPKDESDISFEIIDAERLRPLTKEEKENKALASAQSSAEYYKNESSNLKKEIEELKCQIKVLTKPTEE